MRRLSYTLCVLYISTFPSFSQDNVKCNQSTFNDTLLDKLVGNWKLTGQIGGRSVQNNFTAKWILNHQFLELNFVDVATPPTYMAKVSIGYDCISERYVVHWLDIFGGRLSETLGYGIQRDSTIEFRFEYPEGSFVNEFIYDPKTNSWKFHMTSKNQNDKWKVFGDEYLTKQ